MTWVKICGVNKPEDIRAAEEAGADALGMVLAPSPRQLTPISASRLVAMIRLPVFLVTVDTPWPQLRDWASQIGAQGVQPHGLFSAEASSSAARAGLMVLRPVPVREKVNLADIPEDQTPLLDTYHSKQAGGTGQRIPPEKIPPIERRWVLAGGLNPTNITQALAELSPPGVDVSSGVEAKPGEKDPDRIYAFVQAVRSFSFKPRFGFDDWRSPASPSSLDRPLSLNSSEAVVGLDKPPGKTERLVPLGADLTR